MVFEKFVEHVCCPVKIDIAKRYGPLQTLEYHKVHKPMTHKEKHLLELNEAITDGNRIDPLILLAMADSSAGDEPEIVIDREPSYQRTKEGGGRLGLEAGGYTIPLMEGNNGDNIRSSRRGYSFTVDGAGGNGDAAHVSYIIAETIDEYLDARNIWEGTSSRDVIRFFKEAWRGSQRFLNNYLGHDDVDTLPADEGWMWERISKKVHERFPEKSKNENMSAVMTLAQVITEGDKRKGIFAHTGDVRGYVISVNGVRRITKDHTSCTLDGIFSPEDAVKAKNLLEQKLTNAEIAKQLTEMNPVFQWTPGEIGELKEQLSSPDEFIKARPNRDCIEPTITEVELHEDDVALLIFGDGGWRNETEEEIFECATQGARPGENMRQVIKRRLRENAHVIEAHANSKSENEWAEPDDISGNYVLIPELKVA